MVSGITTTYAGQLGTSGHADGQLTNAIFNSVAGIVVDSSSVFYVSGQGYNYIRRISQGLRSNPVYC
jgi:hypothetical protein